MILENKTAIITGATRGIGHAIAVRFAKEGCNVAFCGRTRNAAMEAVEAELNAIYSSNQAITQSAVASAQPTSNQAMTLSPTTTAAPWWCPLSRNGW